MSPLQSSSLLLKAYLLRRDAIVSSIRTTTLLAGGIVVISTVVAFSSHRIPSLFFITLLPLLALQIFESISYYHLLTISRAITGLRAGIVSSRSHASPIVAAGLAVRNSYFALLLCFDSIWMLHAYFQPSPAQTFAEYLTRLQAGPISGSAFLLFTVFFWIAYTLLLIVGSLHADQIEDTSYPYAGEIAGAGERASSPERIPFTVELTCHDSRCVQLNGFRMSNRGKQPLILWPGFFQNGFVYDLAPGEKSLGEYLWRKGFDLWIIHSRGTEGSGGTTMRSCLDDYAAIDIPTVIDFVTLHTGMKPVYVGHSQGGITAIMSMMGAHKHPDGSVVLSDEDAGDRQSKLRGLVTMGSFLDFNFSRESWLKDFALEGIVLKIFGRNVRLITGTQILALLRPFPFIPTPIGFTLREKMLREKAYRILFAPIYLLLNFVAGLGLWEFLYHIPNVGDESRRSLFYRTMDGTFHGILTQFLGAVHDGAMCSLAPGVNYSACYHRLRLPVSFVSMEHDNLADPVVMEKCMFGTVSSADKHYIEWKGMGHEDHFMNPEYFPMVFDAIAKVC
jgi:pimeloyl-ACP methyl ester carboxylesterase